MLSSITSNAKSFLELYPTEKAEPCKDSILNNRPLIGMLTQPLTPDMKAQNPALLNDKTSFIQASYVQALQSVGARVVPLIYENPNPQQEIDKLDHLNGVQYNGGDGGDDYLKFGRSVYNRVKQINDGNTYMPIWGTCMGFQYMAIYEATQGEGVLSENAFDSNDENYKLQFLMDPQTTRLFGPLGPEAHKYG